MIMGFKYQMVSCSSPQQILQVTMYHLEILRSVCKSPEIAKSVKAAISATVNLYTSLTNGQWILLQQSLLRFLQGKKTKVSLFLQRNLQAMDGTLMLTNDGLLPFGTDTPGTLCRYSNGVPGRKSVISIEGYENCIVADEMFDMDSENGFNMYISKEAQAAAGIAPDFDSIVAAGKEMASTMRSKGARQAAQMKEMAPGADSKSSAKAELNLLADLLGMGVSTKGDDSDAKPFKVNLFPDNNFDDKDSGFKSGSSSNFISIDIDGAAGAKTFSSYMADLKLTDDNPKAEGKGGYYEEDDDLLALMDSTAK